MPVSYRFAVLAQRFLRFVGQDFAAVTLGFIR